MYFVMTVGRCAYLELPFTDLTITNATEGVFYDYGCIKGYRDDRYRRRVNMTCDPEQVIWMGDFLECTGKDAATGVVSCVLYMLCQIACTTSEFI